MKKQDLRAERDMYIDAVIAMGEVLTEINDENEHLREQLRRWEMWYLRVAVHSHAKMN